MAEEYLDKIPTIGVSISTELPGKRSLVLQTFIERDAAPVDLNALLDKLKDASERQFSFGLVEILEAQLKQEKKIAEDHGRRIEQVQKNMEDNWSKRRKAGKPQLSAQEEKERQQAMLNADESRRRIAQVEIELAAARRKISGE